MYQEKGKYTSKRRPVKVHIEINLQRGVSDLVGGVDVAAVVEQRLDRVHRAGKNGPVERNVAVGVGHERVGSHLQ